MFKDLWMPDRIGCEVSRQFLLTLRDNGYVIL